MKQIWGHYITLGLMLTYHFVWVFCDLYIPTIYTFPQYLVSKCLVELFLRPLRSKDVLGLISLVRFGKSEKMIAHHDNV